MVYRVFIRYNRSHENRIETARRDGCATPFSRRPATELRQLKSENAVLWGEKAVLQEQLNLLLHKRFGANSENYRAEQADLFNEAEAYAEESGEAKIEDADSAAVEAPVERVTEPTAPRKPGRKALPAELPRVEIIHDLSEDPRYCAEGHALKVIGEEISEQLDIIPAKVQVLRHIRKKYACPCCQAHVKTATLPRRSPFPKAMPRRAFWPMSPPANSSTL